MAIDDIDFKEIRNINPELLQKLFRAEQWNDYYDLNDIAHILRSALHVVSAWHNGEVVGCGRIEGDGRTWVEITDVLVRSDYQGRGIGTEMVRRLVEEIKRLDPYHIHVEPIDDRAVHLYRKFGFEEVHSRQMQLRTEKLERGVQEVRKACE